MKGGGGGVEGGSDTYICNYVVIYVIITQCAVTWWRDRGEERKKEGERAGE